MYPADKAAVILAMYRKIERVNPTKAIAQTQKMIDAALAAGDIDKAVECARLQGIWIERLSNSAITSLKGSTTRKAGHAKRAPLRELLRQFIGDHKEMKNAKIAAAFLSKYPEHDSGAHGPGPECVSMSHLIQRLIPAIRKTIASQ
jgi:hypothetical protein